MPALEPLCYLLGINPSKLSKEENIILEVDLYLRIGEELKEMFRQEYKDYFYLLKFTLSMENIMLEDNFIRLIMRDILSTGEYSLQGIARYIDTPEDIVYELASGLNAKPLAVHLRKTIELHRSVRPSLYQAIGEKIICELLTNILTPNKDRDLKDDKDE